jgi:hypothetical protein
VGILGSAGSAGTPAIIGNEVVELRVVVVSDVRVEGRDEVRVDVDGRDDGRVDDSLDGSGNGSDDDSVDS